MNKQKHKIIKISKIFKHINKIIILYAWLYNSRSSNNFIFLQLRDGSGFIQCIVSKKNVGKIFFNKIKKIKQETSIVIKGQVRLNLQASNHSYEIHAININTINKSIKYPISKKQHGNAFLINNKHLWIRSQKQYAILKIRASLIKIIRDYLDKNEFTLIDSPIITTNSCEDDKSLFKINWFKDKKAYLSQSGQLYQEASCMAFGKSYSFGPVFRAEKSKTRRHLCEFWMIEPEVSFMDLEKLIIFIEKFLTILIKKIIKKHEKTLTEILKRDLTILKKIHPPFVKMKYEKAIKISKKLAFDKKNLNNTKLIKTKYGNDFGSTFETKLTKLYSKPIIIYGFPSNIKAFYMKKYSNSLISKSIDVLAPEGYGEIIGGGERETDIDYITKKINENNLTQNYLEWFIDLRKYGSVTHSGFGLGLERIISWICGLKHVRESIPFPRTMDKIYP